MNFMSMEYFIMVAAKRNFTQAAEELHITQQTLSAHIARLEKELDVPLFIRCSPLELTYAGEVLLRHAMSLYEGYLSMWNEFNDLTENQRGKLLVGINYTRSRTIMPQIILEFQKKYPHIEVRLREGTNDNLHQSLANHDIDLAIARFPTPVPGVEILDFYEEEVVMVASPGLLGLKAPRRNVYVRSLENFSKYPFLFGSNNDIGNVVGRRLVEEAGFTANVRVQSNDIETLLTLCSMGAGICFAPLSVVHYFFPDNRAERVQIFHFQDRALYPIRFGYRKSKYHWNIMDEFIEIARGCIPDVTCEEDLKEYI